MAGRRRGYGVADEAFEDEEEGASTGRPAMTARDRPRDASRSTGTGDPLTFNVAGLMAEPMGTVREYEIAADRRRAR